MIIQKQKCNTFLDDYNMAIIRRKLNYIKFSSDFLNYELKNVRLKLEQLKTIIELYGIFSYNKSRHPHVTLICFECTCISNTKRAANLE